jgi:cytochrome P450
MHDQSTLTLTKPHFMDDPYPTYEVLRSQAPVFFDSKLNVYHVTSYELIHEVLSHHEIFSNVPNPAVMPLFSNEQEIEDLYAKEGGWLSIPVLITADPPEHTELRAIVQKAMTFGIVKRMNPAIRLVANELIDAFGRDGTVEFMGAFAKRLPLYVIADLLGVPREHEVLLHRMADATTTMGDGGLRSREEILSLHRVQIEGQKVFQRFFEQYREKPEENMLSYLILARFESGCPLSDRQLHSLIQLFLVGGNDTSPGALGNGMMALARNQRLQSELRSDPTLIPKFVEEVLRFESPVAGLYRFVARDTQLGGVALAAGATVSCRLNAGNRDPGRFENPDVLDIARKGARNHLAFGAGVHYCVGVNLGRAEVTIGWETLLGRLATFRLQDAQFEPVYQDKLIVRNPVSIPIAFERRI